MRGIKLQDDDFNRRSDVEKDYTRVGLISLGDIGSANLLENPRTGGQILMFHHEYQNMQQMEAQLAYAKSRSTVKSHHLNCYFDFTSNTKRNPYTGQFWVRHFAEMPKVYLSQILADSRYANVASSSIFLTQLLYQIIMAGESLEKVGLSHGCISPEYISFIEPHTFRLAENLSCPSSIKMIENLIKNRMFKYTSPEVFQLVMMGQPSDRVNVSKHDVFCLGLMIMHMALNFDLNEIYNQDGTFNIPRFKQMKEVFVRKYREMDNRLLAYTVAENMLEMDVGSRLDFKALKTKLPSLKEVNQFLQKDYQLNQNHSCQIYPQLESSYLEERKALELSRQADTSTLIGANTSMFFEPIHNETNLKSITSELRNILEAKKHHAFVKNKYQESLLSGISDAFSMSNMNHFLTKPATPKDPQHSEDFNNNFSQKLSVKQPERILNDRIPNPVAPTLRTYSALATQPTYTTSLIYHSTLPFHHPYHLESLQQKQTFPSTSIANKNVASSPTVYHNHWNLQNM
jgi:hypothetical protein